MKWWNGCFYWYYSWVSWFWWAGNNPADGWCLMFVLSVQLINHSVYDLKHISNMGIYVFQNDQIRTHQTNKNNIKEFRFETNNINGYVFALMIMSLLLDFFTSSIPQNVEQKTTNNQQPTTTKETHLEMLCTFHFVSINKVERHNSKTCWINNEKSSFLSATKGAELVAKATNEKSQLQRT